MEHCLTDQAPTHRSFRVGIGPQVADLPTLGQEPAQIRPVQQVHRIAGSGGSELHPGTQQRLGGEEGHLGVIGEVARRQECGQSIWPIALTNVVNRYELNWRTKGITHGPGKQAPHHASQGPRRHCFTLPRTLPVADRQTTALGWR